MKLKLKKLSEMGRALDTLLETPIDFKLAYRMRKISGKILSEMQHIETARMDLLKKYGDKVKDQPGRLQVPEAKMDAFVKEFDSFLGTEIDFGAELIPFECIENLGKISPANLADIEVLIAEPEKKAPEAKRPPTPKATTA
jgi:hypothetical protein